MGNVKKFDDIKELKENYDNIDANERKALTDELEKIIENNKDLNTEIEQDENEI